MINTIIKQVLLEVVSCDFVGCHGTNAPRHFLQLGDRRKSEKGKKNKNIECFALARIKINVGTSFGILLNYTCVYIHTLDFAKGRKSQIFNKRTSDHSKL